MKRYSFTICADICHLLDSLVSALAVYATALRGPRRSLQHRHGFQNLQSSKTRTTYLIESTMFRYPSHQKYVLALSVADNYFLVIFLGVVTPFHWLHSHKLAQAIPSQKSPDTPVI